MGGVIEDDARAWRHAVDAAYSDEVERFYESGGPLLDKTLHPRGRHTFFDWAETHGLNEHSNALDVGSRDGRHVVEVEDRFRCRVTGVEPAPGNLARMHRRFPERRLRVVRGVAEALPLPNDTFDVVWIRDVLVHVANISGAFAEVARVLRPEGVVLVHHVFATDLLEPREATELWRLNSVVPQNFERPYFEEAIASAGLRIVEREELGSEWREEAEEREATGTRDLLRLTRLRRRPAHYRELLGDRLYDIELGNRLYGIYELIGKLTSVLYVIAPNSARE
jgi:ubiquinone/menaquinone biosynthesis C-methylase UbiE